MTEYESARLKELQDEVARRQGELDNAKKKLRAFQEYLSVDEGEVTPPVAKRATKAPAKTPVPVKKARVGAKPSLKDSIYRVLTPPHTPASAAQILALLQAEDLMPGSNDPIAYIRSCLASNPDIFERVPNQRGYYARAEARTTVPAASPSATEVLGQVGVDLPPPAPSF